MPSLSDALKVTLAGYTPVTAIPGESTAHISPPIEGNEPVLNPMMRCPLPVLLQTTGDSQRQFYRGGMVPQFRFLSLPVSSTPGSSSGNAVVNNTTIINNGGGTTPVTPTVIAAQTATLTTTLAPNQVFSGTLPTTRSFQLLTIAANAACRFQLYGTSNALVFDSSRAIDIPPAAGTTQNILCDVVLDTSPFQWTFQNRAGANADTPQNPLAYIAVTNLGAATMPIRVALTYVPLEA